MTSKVITSDAMRKIWVLMLMSKESAQPAESVWAGLMRVNRLASEYVREHYGPAAIEVNGRFYTPDCQVVREEMTAAEKRAEILRKRSEA